MHNISLESMFHWLSKNILKVEVNVGFTSTMQKCNTISDVLASSRQQAVTRGEVIVLCCHSWSKYINTQYGLPGKGEV